MAAPIVLLAYNRPGHLIRTIDALKGNTLATVSQLYIFSDGPKNRHDARLVQDVRSILKNVSGFKETTIIHRDCNLGLSRSVISAITQILEFSDRVIVLEDDMLTSRYFLEFMNNALELYKDIDRVISIHGYSFPTESMLPETYFLRGADCWGWATWRRGWKHFEPNGRELYQAIIKRGLNYDFDFLGSYPYTRMLKDQINGKNDSWAIRWYASAYLRDMLTLYPAHSLVQNIGNDGTGTHSSNTQLFHAQLTTSPVTVSIIPLEENTHVRTLIARYLNSTKLPWHRHLMKKYFR